MPRIRWAALALGVAGILFVLYPAIRPFSDEASLRGAAAFASTSWILAHMLAMLGFILLMVGLLGLYLVLSDTRTKRLAFAALVSGLIAIGLTLPFYGGEAFGLHAIGQRAVEQHSSALMSLAPVVRSGPQLVMFLIGLLILGVASILAAIAIWKSGSLAKWSGIPFSAGFALYIPQFFGSQPIRVVHGILVMGGCLWIAVEMWRAGRGGTKAPISSWAVKRHLPKRR